MISKQGLSFIIFGILSWLLSPEDFGVLSTAMIIVTFLESFIESGFSSALIQRQNTTNKHFSSIFYINIVAGASLTIIGYFAATPFAIYFDNALLKPVIQILSLGFFINALSLTQIALAQKKLLFRNLAIRDTIATIVSGIIGITLALLGFGIWSLVAQTIITYLINTIILWSITTWKPRRQDISLAAVRELWPYSSRLFVFNFVKFFAQNTEKFFIAVVLGTVALGVYTFAYKFTVLPITMFVGSIGIYLFPKFSQIQNDLNRAATSYLQTTRIVQAVITPIVCGLIVTAPIVIPLIWQDKWLSAIAILQILAGLAYVQTLISPVGQLLKAFNRPGWLLTWSIGVTAAIAGSLPLVAKEFQLAGVAWSLTIIYCIGLPINYWFVKKLLPVSLRDIGRAVVPSLISAVVATLLFITITLLINNQVWLQLVTGITLAAAAYIGLLYWFDRSSIQIVTNELGRFWRKKTQPAQPTSADTSYLDQMLP